MELRGCLTDRQFTFALKELRVLPTICSSPQVFEFLPWIRHGWRAFPKLKSKFVGDLNQELPSLIWGPWFSQALGAENTEHIIPRVEPELSPQSHEPLAFFHWWTWSRLRRKGSKHCELVSLWRITWERRAGTKLCSLPWTVLSYKAKASAGVQQSLWPPGHR